MQIECILKREGGTNVEIDGINYHFAPLPDGAHVADVADKIHVKRFLSIPEAYELYDPTSAAQEIKATVSPEVLLGSSVHPASFEIGEKTYTIGEVADAACKHFGGLSAEAWNALSEEDRADMIDAMLDQLAEEAGKGGSGGEQDDLAALVEQYEAKFGKKPNGRMSIEKLREALAG